MSLKTIREQAGLSQVELGQRLAKSLGSADTPPKFYQPRISAYESGRNTMPLNVAVALTDILRKALKKAGQPHDISVESLVPSKKKPRGV